MSLIVADGKGDEVRDEVSILDVGVRRGRLRRLTESAVRVLRLGLHQNADIYHLHDPELLPGALWLKARGKCVVFDAHEDLPRQIISKPYLSAPALKVLSFVAGALESFVCRRLDMVVAATPSICEKFVAKGIQAETVNNFPMLGELEADATLWTGREGRTVCYLGGISAIRGIHELIAALSLCRSGARLALAGGFAGPGLRDEVVALPGWEAVNELGFVSRADVRGVLATSIAGIVTFLSVPNHTESQPNKMFEYMSAGLPVIASNFPLWREIIEGNECGLCVDPADPAAIAAAIDQLVDDPIAARRWGENGRRAVYDRYNWESEKTRLLKMYEKLEP